MIGRVFAEWLTERPIHDLCQRIPKRNGNRAGCILVACIRNGFEMCAVVDFGVSVVISVHFDR
jgi:hypothetical protein